MNLDEFVGTCRTGDIILCGGTRWYSKIIEWFFNSPVSHIGLVYRDSNTSEIYMFQSKFWDGAHGVRLTPINDILDEFKNGRYQSLYTRKLDEHRTCQFHTTFKYILGITMDKKYDSDPLDWIKIIIQHDFGNIHKTNEFICSALVAFAYIQLGYLTPDVPWSILTPNEFSSVCNMLKFNCKLSNDIIINK
jgi:hypothetical protein